MMAINLPRERKGTILRPQVLTVSNTAAWWVVDDLGPYDGPHETQDAAWDRVCEIYADDEREWQYEYEITRVLSNAT